MKLIFYRFGLLFGTPRWDPFETLFRDFFCMWFSHRKKHKKYKFDDREYETNLFHPDGYTTLHPMIDKDAPIDLNITNLRRKEPSAENLGQNEIS